MGQAYHRNGTALHDMFLAFVIGLMLGGASGWYLYHTRRRELVRLDEEKQLLRQEKQIVLEFMHNLADAMGQGVSREELFRRVVHAAVVSTGALSAAIFERTPNGRLRGVAMEGLFPPQRPLPATAKGRTLTRAKFLEQVLRSEEYEEGESLIGEVALRGQGIYIVDAAEDPRVVHHDDPTLAIRSLIVAPMRFQGVSLGVLAVANPLDGNAFNETDFSLVQSLAEQAAMAIHNLDLMALQIEKNKLDMDLSIASSVQGMLLPKTFPHMPGIKIDAYYHPAQKVGGDLYDVFLLPNGRLGLAVADVSGKGMPASLLMAICQSNLRHLAKLYESPARVLTQMNAIMHEDMRQDMFVTMIYAIFDPKNSEIVIARAGHELPLVCHRSADNKVSIERPSSEGMALGMVPTELFEMVIQDRTIPFNEGDTLVFFTDGITEAADTAGQEYSGARLEATVSSSCYSGPREINQAIFDSVNRFSDKRGPTDDITLLTMQRS